MNELFFQSFIDEGKWNAAHWKAVVFMNDIHGDAPPCLGIAFMNGEVGKQIFRDWLKRFGQADDYEELRISIIEGDIPHEEPGYTVHISSEPSNTQRRARDNGVVLDTSMAVVVGRVHRMNPEPDSPHLALFKQQYNKHRKYLLIPVTITISSKQSLVPHLDYAIGKKEIHFRHVSEIEEGDIDSVIYERIISDNGETVH
jgi:hypothetical protein